MEEDLEPEYTRVYTSQTEWIKENIGEQEAAHANYGWGIDGGNVCTKVYGPRGGVLETHIDDPDDHDFEPWGPQDV